MTTLDDRPWVWDASPLVHASRAVRIDEIADLVARRSVDHRTTSVVVDEVRRAGTNGEGTVAAPGWLEVDDREEVEWLAAVSDWVVPLGVSGHHNLGEASCFALAGAVAGVLVVDDQKAAAVAGRRGLPKIGIPGVLDDAERMGHHTMASAAAVVRDLADSGGRYPAQAVTDFPRWCHRRRVALGLS